MACVHPVDEGCADAVLSAVGVGGEVQQRRPIGCGAVSDHTDRQPGGSGDGEDRGSGPIGQERHVEAVPIFRSHRMRQERDDSVGVEFGLVDGDMSCAHQATLGRGSRRAVYGSHRFESPAMTAGGWCRGRWWPLVGVLCEVSGLSVRCGGDATRGCATGMVAVTARVVVSMIEPEPAVSPSVSGSCGVRPLSVKSIARGDDQQLVVSRTQLLRSLRLSSGHDTGLLSTAFVGVGVGVAPGGLQARWLASGR